MRHKLEPLFQRGFFIVKMKEKVPNFTSVDHALSALAAKDNFLPEDLYPRDGSIELHRVEGRFGELAGCENILLYNSGMAAIRDAIEIVQPTRDTKILRGHNLYNQSSVYIDQDLAARGVKPTSVDSGCIEDIEKRLKVVRPDIILFETVANGQDVPILDLEKFLSLPILNELDPHIILDNTLPTSTILPLGEIMKNSNRKIVAVESGTKFYSFNREMCGMAYTENEEIFNKLQVLRRKGGATPGPSTVTTLNMLLPESRDQFDRRNKRILRNTLSLANSLNEAAANGPVIVSHPNLEKHDNSKYANKHFPEGATPVFFLQIDMGSDLNQIDVTRKLWEHPIIRSNCTLGQSFGFETTRIWFDKRAPFIRISGGAQSESKNSFVAKAFCDVLESINNR